MIKDENNGSKFYEKRINRVQDKEAYSPYAGGNKSQEVIIQIFQLFRTIAGVFAMSTLTSRRTVLR